ncbi:nitrate- and nitrite sensing domain-containing protein [Actinomycetota bacterium Odt1-20B]
MQGRFKRDGSAAAEPERGGGTDRGSSAQHAQNPGQAPGDSGPQAVRQPAAGGSLPAAPAKPKGPSGPGSRIALRNWRISTRLVSLLALPVVAATTLGGLRINNSLEDIQQLDNMKLLTEMTKQATELAAALQEERDQSAGPLAHGATGSDYKVKGTREKTDRAYNAFLQGTQDLDDSSDDEGLLGVRANTVQITAQLRQIKDIRSSAYDDKNSSSRTVDAYSQLIQQLLGLSEDMAQATSNPDMIRRTRALAAFSSAKEYASIQRAIIAAALPENDKKFGELSGIDRQYGWNANTKEHTETQTFSSVYSGNAAELTKPLTGTNSNIKSSDQYAKRVLEQNGGLKLQSKRSYMDWLDEDSTKIEAMSKIELTLLDEMEQKARELRNDAEQDAIINGALILLVLGVSLVGAFVVARSMIRSLRRLQDTATKVAQDRLPELVKQLSESDPQDVDTSVESVGVHSRDEIGQVAAAFDDVHREAVRLAAEQALLRGNVNAMFTNLSRRSQGLIQRQLSLISELESREADPDQLSSLFKLDHLATRMRRNGENLLVLAGEEPGRRWTRPVPLVDVLRAAASEVEQYERIELSAVPSTEVAGRVVNDLVHLLAELLENATSFSSPQTKVKVTGHALPDGRVLIEIHDTGIGLSPEDLASINERLASPPTVDVSVSRRMGLFVVGRLSQRHGIRIQLRPSDSGGTTALVMLPVDVAQGGKKGPGAPGPTGGPAAAQAAAGAAAARRGVSGGSGAPGLGAGPGLGGPGLTGGPGGQGGPGGGNAGRLGAGSAPRGQVAGTGPRAALPSRETGTPQRSGSVGGPGGPGGAGGPGGPGGPGGLQPAGPTAPQGGGDQGNRGDLFRPAGDQGGRPGTPGQQPQRPPVPQQRTNEAEGRQGQQGQRRRPQLPPRGGPRAELPGGNPQPRVPSWSDENAQPQVSHEPFDAPRGHEEPESTGQFARPAESSGTGQFNLPESGAPGSQSSTGQFQQPDAFQQPESTGQFAQADSGSGAGSTGQFQRPETTGQFQQPDATGQFARPGADDRQGPGSTAEFARPDFDGPPPGQQSPQAPQPPQAQSPQTTGQFAVPGVPRPPAPRRGQDQGVPQQPQGPAQQQPQQPQQPAQPEPLPPAADPGDGRTPLYDTLETNWFHTQQGAQDPQTGGTSYPQSGAQDRGAQDHGTQDRGPQQREPEPTRGEAPAPEQPRSPLPPRRPQAAQPGQPAQPSEPTPPQRPATAPGGSQGGGVGNGPAAGWRTSPNDELGRQAERVRQPSAGGVTTSGLPRRVPRANLVAGTAQQQQDSTGPQVSRAPDDVRGRLTNLRRGIQQGRQAGSGQTGSFPSPTHQQER